MRRFRFFTSSVQLRLVLVASFKVLKASPTRPDPLTSSSADSASCICCKEIDCLRPLVKAFEIGFHVWAQVHKINLFKCLLCYEDGLTWSPGNEYLCFLR